MTILGTKNRTVSLCNRVFVLSDDGYGDKMKYESYFLTPELAKSFLHFINPERWREGNFWNSGQTNLDCNGKSAYDAKAIAFTRSFLGRAWNCRSVLEYRHGVGYRDLGEEEQASLENRIRFFHNLKPTIAKLLVHYGMTSHLHDSPLNRPTRRVLWEIVQPGMSRRSKIDLQMVDLAQAYGELTPEGQLASSHREVLRVLLLYPSLVAGRKAYIRAKLAHKTAVKDAAIAEAERKFAEATAALQKLK